MITRAGARRLMRHVPVLLRGRPLHGAERYRPFFIVGSGRCGSTLLRAMLEAHPDVHIPPEIHVFASVVRDFHRYSRLPWNVLLRIVLSQFEIDSQWEAWELSLGPVLRELAVAPPAGRNLAAMLAAVFSAHTKQHKPTAHRWGDKRPLNAFQLRPLRAVFPDLRVIHIVRDGRDVVESLLRGLGDQLPLLAQHWVDAVHAARAFGVNHPTQYLEVRYEELVHQPRESMQRVAAFLDLPFDERMLRHHEFDLHLGDVERTPYLQGVWEPIHEKAIGRWRRDFTTGQIAELERVLGPTLALFGYNT